MAKPQSQWQNLVEVVRSTGRADCGHPSGRVIFRFQKDTKLNEIWTVCAQCGADAERRGEPVYVWNPGEKVPVAIVRKPLS